MSRTWHSRKRRKAQSNRKPARKSKPKENRRKADRDRLRKRKLGDGCTGKRKLVSKGEAVEVAVELIQRGKATEVGAYLCRVCSHLHLTSTVNDGCCVVVELEAV